MKDLLYKINERKKYLTGLKNYLRLNTTLQEIIESICPDISSEQINSAVSLIKSVFAGKSEFDELKIDGMPRDLLEQCCCNYFWCCFGSISKALEYIKLRRIIPQSIESRRWFLKSEEGGALCDYASIEDIQYMFSLYPEYKEALKNCHDRYSDRYLGIIDSNNTMEYNRIIHKDSLHPVKRILSFLSSVQKETHIFESLPQIEEYISNNDNALEGLNNYIKSLRNDSTTYNNYEEVHDASEQYYSEIYVWLCDKGTEEEKELFETFVEECGMPSMLQETDDAKNVEAESPWDEEGFLVFRHPFHVTHTERVEQLAKSFYADSILIITNIYRHFYEEKHYVSIAEDTDEYNEIRKFANNRIKCFIKASAKYETAEGALGQLFWNSLGKLVESNAVEIENELLENSLNQLCNESALEVEVNEMKSLFAESVLLPLALNVDDITAKVILKSRESIEIIGNKTFYFNTKNILEISYHLEKSNEEEFINWAYLDSHDLHKSLFCIIHNLKKTPNNRLAIVYEQIFDENIKSAVINNNNDNDDYFEILNSVDSSKLTEFSTPKEFHKCLNYGKKLYEMQQKVDDAPNHKDWFIQIPEDTYKGGAIQLIKNIKRLFELLYEQKFIQCEENDIAKSEFLYRFSGYNCPLDIKVSRIVWTGDITVLGYIIRCLFQRSKNDKPPFASIRPFFKYNSKSQNFGTAKIEGVKFEGDKIYPPAFRKAYNILLDSGFINLLDFMEDVETNAPK